MGSNWRQVCAARQSVAVIDFTKSINGLHKDRVNRITPGTAGFGRMKRRLYGLYAVLAFAVITACTVVLMAVIPGRHNRLACVHRAAALILFVTGVTPRITGRDNLPTQPCIVVANHASYLDGIILMAVLPPRFAFVIKREMARVPLAGFMLRRIGSEFVERFDNRKGAVDARRIMQSAAIGQSLAFFPEGTFRSEPGLRRFHSGAFATARRGNLPLVPVIIRGSRDMLPAQQHLPTPGSIEVIIKPAIAPGDPAVSAERLLQICRAQILADLAEPDTMQPPPATAHPT